MTDGAPLVATNIHFIEQGIFLLEDINDDLYTNVDYPHFKSGVGRHMRHVLEHYLGLLAHSNGKIDYDARERDQQVENDRAYAISVAEGIIEGLNKLVVNSGYLDQEVLIRNNEGTQTRDDAWSRSTVRREFQFLISHTVHHYALVAIILRIQGYYPDEEFGVAPSTLRYENQLQDKATG